MKKLSVIRSEYECPFGLPIVEACQSIGDIWKNLAPVELIEDSEINDKEREDLKKVNLDIYSKIKNKSRCPFAEKMFLDKNMVNCELEDYLQEKSKKNLPLNKEDLLKHINPIGMYDNVYTYPIASWSDYGDVLRNNYYGIYNLAYHNNDYEINNSIKKISQINNLEARAFITNNLLSLLNIFNIKDSKFKEQLMPLLKTAQEHIHLEDIVVYPNEAPESALEIKDLHEPHQDDTVLKIEESTPIIEISDDQFKLDEVPGAPEAEELVVDDKLELSDKDEDLQIKPKDIWDWETGGIHNLLNWAKERMAGIPKHDGKSISGIDRAAAYLKKFLKQLDKAAQVDLDGDLDINLLEGLREEILDGIERLEDRKEKLESGRYRKKASFDKEEMVKNGSQAIVTNIVITVPILISRIARACINGYISQGKDIEFLFKKQAEMYKLSEREKVEVVQLLSDMGIQVKEDRLLLPFEEWDQRSTQNELSAQYAS